MNNRDQLPRGETIPSILQTIYWLKDPVQYLEYCQKKYGNVFTMNMGPLFSPQVLISDPQVIKQIYSSNYDELDSGKEANLNIDVPILGKNSLLFASGSCHHRLRILLKPAFHGQKVEDQGQEICRITQELTHKYWLDWQSKKYNYISMSQLMKEISIEIIFNVVLGLNNFSVRQNKLKRLLSEMVNPQQLITNGVMFFFPFLQIDFGSLSPWGKYKQTMEELNQLIYTEIDERRESTSHSQCDQEDILSLMIKAVDENGDSLTKSEIRDQIMTLLLAGYETTSTALSWAVYWINYLGSVKDNLLQQLDTIDLSETSRITNLPYLNAICSETLRIYPPIIIGLNRLVKKTVEFSGYCFEPGTILTPCIYLLHQREEIYPHPQQFEPERFLTQKFTQYQYVPFGGGDRRCIGSMFALFEMKLVLATIAKNWKIKLADESCPETPAFSGAMLAPKNQVKVTLEPRNY